MSGSMEKIRKELKKEIQKYADGLTKEALSDMTLERHWNEPDDTDTYITDLLIGIVNKVGPETIEEVMELLIEDDWNRTQLHRHVPTMWTEDDWNRTQLVIEPLRGVEKEALLDTHGLSPLEVASYVIKRNLFNEGRDELRKAHTIEFAAPDSRFTKVYFNRTHF